MKEQQNSFKMELLYHFAFSVLSTALQWYMSFSQKLCLVSANVLVCVCYE